MKKITAILLVVLLLCSCGGRGHNRMDKISAENGKTLYLTGYNFDSENPLDVKNTVNRHIFTLIYKSLFKIESDGRPTPYLAESAVCSSDNLSWEINLKNNITFHNGEPLSARDVEATVKYLITNDTVYKNCVRNISSVRAVSAYTAVISLKEPAVNFPAQLTFPIIPSAGFGSMGFNGTGDYRVTEYIPMNKMVLTVTDGYVAESNSVSRIEIQLVSDKETAYYANQSGVSDIFLSEELHDSNSELNKSGIKSEDFISNTFGFLLLNNDKIMFKDINVRRAINISINRDEIVSNILFSKAVTASTPIRPGYYLSVPEREILADTEKAKKLLTDGGYTANITTGIFEKEMTYEVYEESAGSDEETEETSELVARTVTENVMLQFEIMVNSENTYRMQIANLISSQLRLAGIDAKVKAVTFEEYQDLYWAGEYDAMIGSMIISDDCDPTYFIGVGGYTRTTDEEGIKIVKDIATSVSEDKKRECYHNLYDYFENKVPLISLYFEKSSLQYSKRVTGGLTPTAFSVFNGIESWHLN